MAEIYPLQILVASLAGWMNRQQGEVLDYLIEERGTFGECSTSTWRTTTTSGITRASGTN